MRMSKKSIKSLINGIKKMYKPHLTGNMTNSIDYVYKNLNEKYAEVALELEGAFDMQLDTYNLHNLIVNYEQYKSIHQMVLNNQNKEIEVFVEDE